MNQDTIIKDNINSLIKRENCFDAIRYFFAFSLLTVHFCTLTNIEQFWPVSGGTRVKAFFIISGFLVFNSFIRKPSIKEYTKKRIKRICPAYFTVIIFCVFIGLIVSNLTTKEYLCSLDTYRYIIANFSFLNFIQPELPGVFINNTEQAVNGSLWSMKVEVLFYVSVPIIYYFLKRYNKKKLIIMLGIFTISILYNEIFIYIYEKTNNQIYYVIKRQIGGQLIYFYSGTFILLYFDIFTKYIKYIFPLAVLLYICKDFNILFSYLESISFACIIIGIAYGIKFLSFLRKYDNISYGIYLYHFPIIQTIIHYNIDKYNIYLAFFLAFIGTIFISIISWYLIEKPIIKGKYNFSFKNINNLKKTTFLLKRN